MTTAPELLERTHGRERQLTLSSRLRWALVGVALFVVPMAALLVWFLARVYAASQAQVAELDLATTLEAAWDPVRTADLATRAARDADDLLAAFDVALAARVEESPLHVSELDDVRAAVEEARQAVGLLRRASAGSAPAGDQGTLFGRLVAAAGSASSEVALAPLRGLVRQRVIELSLSVAQVRTSALGASTDSAAELLQAVDAANRNLVTLALALLVYLGYLYLFLPSRLLASFARIRATLRQARSGDLAVRAPTEGDDDAAVLSREFNAMMEVIERFDLRKRQKIYQDAQVIRALGAHLGTPFALLGLEGRIDAANAAFWTLLERPAPASGVRPHMSDLVGVGARQLSDLVARSLEARRPIEDHPVVVQGSDGVERSLTMSAAPVRSTDARLTHLLVTLRPV